MWLETLISVIEKVMNSPQTRPSGEVHVPAKSSIRLPRRRLAVTQQQRQQRIYDEIMMIAPNFSKHEGVCYDEENCDWLIIPKYPLPAKWRNRWCKLLVVFPQLYPMTPPIGFYLNRRFRLKYGARDPHFTGSAFNGAPDLLAQGWFWYCVRIKDGSGGWKPSADFREHDNLWTFLAMVRESLTNDY